MCSSPRTSRNASSIDSPSTTGVVSSNTSKTALLASRVGRHPRRDGDHVRTEATGLATAHRGADAVCARLVAGREHDSHPDDDGSAAQATVVSLLDRREERVEVGVEDVRLASHEHMFAYPRLSGCGSRPRCCCRRDRGRTRRSSPRGRWRARPERRCRGIRRRRVAVEARRPTSFVGRGKRDVHVLGRLSPLTIENEPPSREQRRSASSRPTWKPAAGATVS